MGYLGRRIGKSQDVGTSDPSGADGAVGGGILDLFANGYFQKQGKVYNAPGTSGEGLEATGGVISDYAESGTIYRAHTFTASGAFEVTKLSEGISGGDDLEYLVVAGGGGGGGGYYGGGGGAGGLRTNLSGHPLATGNPSFTVTAGPTSYTVTIGGGGAPGMFPGSPNAGNDAGQGVDSYFGPPSTPEGILSKGGGKGMGRGTSAGSETDGYPGGSGGGIAYRGPAVGYGYNPSAPTPILNAVSPALPSPYTITQGNPGGAAPGSNFGSAGGGAGGAGGAGTGSPYGADGGIGVQVYIGGSPTTTGIGETSQWFAGGGGGGSNGPSVKVGGVGGGGNAANSLNDVDAESGMSATGGGGGGGSDSPNSTPGSGGAGGSGIVIVRYKIGTVAGAKATGGSISYYGGKTIHTFLSSGDFNNTTGADLTGCEVVILGGGGGGGMWQAGGGGAGRFYRNDDVTISPGPNGVTVGAGGAGASAVASAGAEGNKGASSVFNSVTMIGGGAGAKYDGDAANPGPGGSGGGGAGGPGNPQSATPSDVTAVTNQDTPPVGAGNPGANGQTAAPHGGGGGGGAGGTATAGSSGNGGPGGLGIQLPTTFRDPASTVGYPSGSPSVGYFVGGGGGGSAGPPSAKLGGGGAGAPQVPQPNQAADGSVPIANMSTYQWAGAGFGVADASGLVAPSALANSGSGGGGCGDGYPQPGRYGGNGGSGLVLIAYPT